MYEEKKVDVIPELEEPFGDSSNPNVWMDIQIGENEPRRIVIELFAHVVPKTAENFRALCTGEKGDGESGQPLHYKDTVFHRIIKDFIIQGGDVSEFNGKGGESIYGKHFSDENFRFGHTRPGLLSMASGGANTNQSQFFITFRAIPKCNKKNVVFGQVIEGFDVCQEINAAEVTKDVPNVEIKVVNCGQLEHTSQQDVEMTNSPVEAQEETKQNEVAPTEG